MRAICALLGYAATASGFALGPVATAPRALAVHSIGRAALCTMQEDAADGAEPMVGTCKWFNVEKGYGFIAVTGEDRDIFVHQSDIYAPGFRSLAEGEPLEFRVETDDKTGKLKAVDVTGPEGAYVQGAPRRQDDDFY